MPIDDQTVGPEGEHLSETVEETITATPEAMALAGRPAEVERPRGAPVGRYVLLDELGRGGMGVVYAAYDPELDRKLAIKLMRAKGGSAGPYAKGRLLREAQAMARLNHRNVIAVHDVGTVDDEVFVAMEFVDGQPLGDWQADRPWREVLAMHLQAGRGLEGAHAAGLTHRDYKPDNVLVDTQGRAVVLDFGLARIDESTLGELEDLELTSSSSLAGRTSASVSLTETGAIMGTPAYMAPEQHRGKLSDAKGDQFSFCVALWEGMCGQRPYKGDTLTALAFQVTHGKRRAFDNREVPPRVVRALERGMSPGAEDRWPDIGALLEELEAGAAPRRRAPWVVGAIGVGGLAAAFVMAGEGESAPTCEGSGSAIEAQWNDDARAKLRASFEASELPYAAATADLVVPKLDEWANAWAVQSQDACRAVLVDHTEGAADRLRRESCLETRLAAFGGVLEAFSAGDPNVVEEAIATVDNLPATDVCGDLEALALDVAPPTDPAVAAEVAEIRRELASAEALANAGHLDGLEDEAKALLQRAEAIEYLPVLAQAQLFLDAVRDEGGEERGHDLAMEALANAERADAHFLKLEAAIEIAASAAYEDTRSAHRWLRYAQSVRQRLGSAGEDLEVKLRNTRGVVAIRDGDYAAAKQAFTEAATLADEVLGPTSDRAVSARANVAATALYLGQYEEALAGMREVLATNEKRLPPNHPSLGLANNNLGSTLQSVGRYEDAIPYHEASRRIWKDATDDWYAVPLSLGQLSRAKNSLGDCEGSLADAREAVKMVRGTEHESSYKFSTALARVGIACNYGAPDAMAYLVESAELADATMEKTDSERAVAWGQVAYLHLRRGQLEEAEAAIAKAKPSLEKLADDHPRRGALMGLEGRLLFAQGKAEEAQPMLRLALEMVAGERPTLARAEVKLDLAELTGESYLAAEVLAELNEMPAPYEQWVERAEKLVESGR